MPATADICEEFVSGGVKGIIIGRWEETLLGS